MTKTDISVIIPVYNVEAYIEACLRSVIEQEHQGFRIECIIVDDCGYDNSMDVVRRIIRNYDGDIKFKIIEHDKNGGPSAARNTAIRAACGQYVTFLDSDDRLLPGALSGMSQLTAKYPGVDIVQGEVRLNQPNEFLSSVLEISSKKLPTYISGINTARHTLLFDVPVTSWGKFIRRDFIISNDLFFTEDMIVHEDDMWSICASQYIETIAFYFTPFYYYNNNITNSLTQKSDKTKSLIGRTALISKAAECYSIKPCLDYYEYLSQRLDFVNKSEIWKFVKNRKTANKAIVEMRHSVVKANCPLPLKLAASYFNLPTAIGANRIILPMFRRLSGLFKKYYIHKFNNN